MSVSLVDADVHPVPQLEELIDYVAEPYRSRYYRRFPNEIETHPTLYQVPTQSFRLDAIGPHGETPGSDPALADRQLFQEAAIDFAILIPLFPRPKIWDPEWESALWSACNDWLAETWLSKHNRHGRYRGSIRVCPYDPDGAVREIERWAGHPYVAQITVFPESPAPFGQAQFHPFLGAAARSHLPVAMHIVRQPAMRTLTPVGFPSYHLEVLPQWSFYFMTHLTSLVFEGVFDRMPDLKIVCVEGGFSWLAPLLWRLDNNWQALAPADARAARRPSAYLKEHVRLTTQPVEEPVRRQDLMRLMGWIEADRLLMFATDYPHYDFDDPAWVLPRLPMGARARICCQNAIELYGLPSDRPLDALDLARNQPAGAAAHNLAAVPNRPSEQNYAE